MGQKYTFSMLPDDQIGEVTGLTKAQLDHKQALYEKYRNQEYVSTGVNGTSFFGMNPDTLAAAMLLTFGGGIGSELLGAGAGASAGAGTAAADAAAMEAGMLTGVGGEAFATNAAYDAAMQAAIASGTAGTGAGFIDNTLGQSLTGGADALTEAEMLTGAGGGNYGTNAAYDGMMNESVGSGTAGTGAGFVDNAAGQALTGGADAATTAATTGGTTAGGTGLDGQFNFSPIDGTGSVLGTGAGVGTAQLVGQGLNLAGGLLTGESARNATNTLADEQMKAAQVAADAAKFRPVGVTNNFGSSKYTYDDKGNITGAGYELAPWLQKQQGMLQAGSQDSLTRGLQAQSILVDQMAPSAGRMFELGSGYLAANPQDQAQKYMSDQQALLAGSRASSYADMQNRLQQTGRAGLSVGGGGGMMAANPEMQAYYNAQRQQDLGLAAQATQGGMDYAKFGVDLTNAGANTLQNMFKTQSAAFDPYKTQMGLMQDNENSGRQNLLDSVNIGNTISNANARAGGLLANGMNNSANTRYDANAYNPWATAISGVGSALTNYRWGT